MTQNGETIRFGPAGNSDSFYAAGYKGTEEMPSWLYAAGLNAFEYSFGRGAFMGADKAVKIAAAAKEYDIQISAHAPYYINFGSTEIEKEEKSFLYILRSIEALRGLGGRRVVFHVGSAGKGDRAEVFARVLDNMRALAYRVENAGYGDMLLCPETMGRASQIGTVEEVAAICKKSDIFLPCVDFGHVNALTQGALKTKDDYRKIIEYFYDQLGERAVRMHIHFSRIQYGARGEIKHLDFTDGKYGPPFEPLMEVLHEYKMTPVVICESDGTMAEDASAMKKYFDQIR